MELQSAKLAVFLSVILPVAGSWERGRLARIPGKLERPPASPTTGAYARGGGLRQTAAPQQSHSRTTRLFRLSGSFGQELSLGYTPEDKLGDAAFAFTAARIEDDGFGFLSRLRSTVTLTNGHGNRRITEVEWRIDIYDESLRNLQQRVLQSQRINIYGGETGSASAKFGAVLPDRMIVLLQLVRVSFSEGADWSPGFECSLEEDLKTVSCRSI